MIELFSYTFSAFDLTVLLLSAIFIGMGKTGVPGAGMVSIYSKYANWSHLKKLLPLTLVGVVIASAIGTYINDTMFRNVMGVTIFIIIALMIWQERNPNPKTPESTWFTFMIGTAGGFTTMIGNLAGPLMGLYLLAMRLPKKEFIGTGAWYFLIVNLFKVPFHIFAWGTITVDSFLLDLALLPGIAVGAIIGVNAMEYIKEKTFRYLVIGITFFAAVFIFI